MKQHGIATFCAVVAFALVIHPAIAQDEGTAPAAAAPADAVTAQPTTAAAASPLDDLPQMQAPRTFYPLLRCLEAHGVVEVMAPRETTWRRAEVGKYYPLGAVVRVSRAQKSDACPGATFGLGPASDLVVTNEAEFATREAPIGEKTRTLLLRRGCVTLKLPRTLKDGEFSVAAPHFVCRNLSGEIRFDYQTTGDGDEAVVHVTTGSMSMEGRHYMIAQLRAANQIRIRTTGDDLFTLLTGESGDYAVKLDQGLVRDKDPVTNEAKDSERFLTYVLSPRCLIKIWRNRASVGGRVVVATMTLDAGGAIKNRCAFAEQRYNVNSGELVVSPKAVEAAAKAENASASDVETVQVHPVAAAVPAATPAAPADAAPAAAAPAAAAPAAASSDLDI